MQESLCGLSLESEQEQELEAEEEQGEIVMDSPESTPLSTWIDNMIEFEQIMDEDTPLASTEQQQQQQQEVSAPRPYYAPTPYAPAYKAAPVSVPRRTSSPAPPVLHPSHSGSPFSDVPGFGMTRSSSPSLPAPPYPSQAFVDSSGLRQHAHVPHGHGHGLGQQQQQQMVHHSQGQQGQVSHRQQQQQQQHLPPSMIAAISRSNSPQPGSLTSLSHAPGYLSGGVTRGLHKVVSAPQLELLGREQQQQRAGSPQSFHQPQQLFSSISTAGGSPAITVPRQQRGSLTSSASARSHSHNNHGHGPADYGMDQYGQPMGGQASPHASHAGSPSTSAGHPHGVAIGPGHGHGAHSRNNSLSGQLSHSLNFSNSPPAQQSHSWAASLPSQSQYAPAGPSANSSAAIPMDMAGHGSASAVARGSQPQEVAMEQQDNGHGLQLVHLLLACAEAMAHGDLIVAKGTLLQLQQMVSIMGDSMHRVAAYFTDALHARLMGKGSRSYLALRAYDPEASEGVQDAYQILYQACPYIKFAHFTSNQAIFEAFDGEERVHIIDLDIVQGYQWPTLMQALAARHGGAPQLRITGVGMPLEAVQETGKGLADLAEFLHIPFEFHAVGERLENLQGYMLQRRVGEALAVNSVNRLHRLLSTSNDPMTPLVGILHMIREQAPKIVTLVEQEASHNDQSFLPRFLEALHYYSAIFDSLDATLPQTSPERAKVEQLVFAQEITNIVACEGAERVERHERLDRWRKIMDSIGFQSVPLSQNAVQQSHLLLGLYTCDGYSLVEDRGCLLLGWQERPIIAASAWQERPIIAASAWRC